MSQSKRPLEFWIGGWDRKEFTMHPGSVITVFLTSKDPSRQEAFKVIEYSAYEALKAEYEELLKLQNHGVKE